MGGNVWLRGLCAGVSLFRLLCFPAALKSATDCLKLKARQLNFMKDTAGFVNA
jgi:hypothetical protein